MSFLFTILFYSASLCLRRLRFGQAWHTPVRLALGVLIALPFAGISGAAAADVTLKIGVEQTKYSLIGSMGDIVYSSLASDNPTIPGVTVRTFDSSGILYLNTSGTPTTTGTYTFNGSYYYYAYDQECGAYYEATVNYGLDYDPPAGKNCSGYYNIVSGTFTRTVEVVAATLSVSPTSLGTLTVGQAASVSLTTTGGSGT
ncbi:hypothetical protein [Allorhizobium undicola]|uniref:hypothetical protein n=1 Tax=Allorhizobium undicola TaxID=78527 RepID=UPI0004842E1A|nr:hypothetical protein [Allorhizobium undicola]